MIRLGVDVGGTFTDLVLINDERGTVDLNKVPTTPDDPSIGTINGALELCESAGVAPREVEQFFHGTTIATNIVLEHNGAKTGLITTEGYRDILHIARHKRPYNFSIQQELPWQKYPLVKRHYRLPVKERIVAPQGEVSVPLDEDGVREAVRRLKDAQVDAVAVCFMFSFLNPAHEKRAGEIVREEWPEVFLSLSARHPVELGDGDLVEAGRDPRGVVVHRPRRARGLDPAVRIPGDDGGVQPFRLELGGGGARHGASEWTVFVEVTLPLILPGIVAAGLFGFTLSYDEFARTTLLSGEYNTLPLDINASMTQRIRPTLFALGTASTLFSLLMIGLFLFVYTIFYRRTR